jgi:hypothetical protein
MRDVITDVQHRTSVSPFRCSQCKRHVNVDLHGKLSGFGYGYCEYCDAYLSKESSDITIARGNAHLRNKINCLTSEWYHCTSRDNWHKGVLDNNVVVHIGTRAAAEYKFKMMENWGDNLYIHVIKLSPLANIADYIYDDLNDWPSRVNRAEEDLGVWDYRRDIPRRGAVRYVNRWEGPGSISILLDPAILEVVHTETYELEHA